ncbi:MAG TPA: photosynthetic complex putative assembly protein PuhB [Polyangiaceae bacterium]|nr:photosynthetic complex putative assembly protein PuhB [Polyangiaceae bacterium]
MSADHEVPPVPGLPGPLPAGERIVWQGRPEWRALARQAFKVRWVAAYFAVLLAARAAAVPAPGHLAPPALAAAGCLGLLTLLAWLNARAAVYTITTRRVVLHVGVAVPTTWNLPFKRLAAADLKVRAEGDGDIVLRLTPPNRIGWALLWPHAQPWHVAPARPALRAIAEPARVASLLAGAVQAWAEAEAEPTRVAPGIAATLPGAAPAPIGLGAGLPAGVGP